LDFKAVKCLATVNYIFEYNDLLYYSKTYKSLKIQFLSTIIYYTIETDNSHEVITVSETVYSMEKVGVLSKADIEQKIRNLKS